MITYELKCFINAIIVIIIMLRLHCFSNLSMDFVHNMLIFTTFYLHYPFSVTPTLQKSLTSFFNLPYQIHLTFQGPGILFWNVKSDVLSLRKMILCFYVFCICLCVTHTAVNVNLSSLLAGRREEGFAFDFLIFPSSLASSCLKSKTSLDNNYQINLVNPGTLLGGLFLPMK